MTGWASWHTCRIPVNRIVKLHDLICYKIFVGIMVNCNANPTTSYSYLFVTDISKDIFLLCELFVLFMKLPQRLTQNQPWLLKIKRHCYKVNVPLGWILIKIKKIYLWWNKNLFTIKKIYVKNKASYIPVVSQVIYDADSVNIQVTMCEPQKLEIGIRWIFDLT